MLSKRKIGIGMLVIGAIAVCYALYGMDRIAEAKGTIDTLTSPFGGSAAGRAVGGILGGEASKYNSTVRFLLVGGIVVAAIGAGVILRYGKKRRH